MNGLFVSQIASMQAPQSEVDKISRGQELTQISQSTNEEVFIKLLNNSMREVGELVSTEKEDQLLKEEDDEEQNEEN